MLMQRIHLNQELDRAANCEQVGSIKTYSGRRSGIQVTPRKACRGNKFSAVNEYRKYSL